MVHGSIWSFTSHYYSFKLQQCLQHRDIRELEGQLQNEAEVFVCSTVYGKKPVSLSVEVTFGVESSLVFFNFIIFFSKFINEIDVTEWSYHVLPTNVKKYRKIPTTLKKKTKNLDAYFSTICVSIKNRLYTLSKFLQVPHG